MAKNQIERCGTEQRCQLFSVTMVQRNHLRNSGFMRGTCCEFQHLCGFVQQRDMKTEMRQTYRHGPGSTANIQYAQRLFGWRQKRLQVGKCKIEAQPALESFKVCGVLRGSSLEAFAISLGSHLLPVFG